LKTHGVGDAANKLHDIISHKIAALTLFVVLCSWQYFNSSVLLYSMDYINIEEIVTES